MTVPPLGLAVAGSLLAGVLLVQGLPTLPPILSLLPLALIAGWLVRRADYRRLLGSAVFGMVLACIHAHGSLQQQLPADRSGTEVWVTGQVRGLPVTDSDATRFVFAVDAAEGTGALLAGRTFRLNWYRMAPVLEPGSRWRLLIRVRPPHGVANPGGFDFERRALEQYLAGTGYVRESPDNRQLSPGGGLDFLRGRYAERIAEALVGERARFVQALVLGDTRGLSDRDWDVLRATGLTHLIAISGFHVGMVAGFAALLAGGVYRLFPWLGRYRPRPEGMAWCALIAAVAYAALAGFALPTVRTLLMIAVVLLARLLRRPQRLVDAFALAVIAVLLVSPLAVLTAGFWLSFLGVAWLMWCLPHERHPQVLRAFLQAQGVAMLGLLPLTVWFFSQTSLAGPWVNLLGIPWISLGVVPVALLGLAASPFSDELANALWGLAAGMMEVLWWCLERIADWPLSMIWLPEPSLPVLALALIGAFWLLLPRGVPGKPMAAVLLVPLFWPHVERPDKGEADIVMLDVGQGLSVLVMTQTHALLFDAGPALPHGMDFGESAVVPALRALGIRRLDALLLSHGDNDHAGGADSVLRHYPGTPVSAPEGWAKPGMDYCRRGQSWQWDGVDFRVLHPPPLYPYQRNESSCVLRIEASGAVALLPGDIGQHVETRLHKEQPELLSADLLVVPHHGSDSSSSGPFLAAVNPAISLFSAGSGNRFGLPKAEVLARYRAQGSVMHASFNSGAVRVRLGAQGAQVSMRYRADQPRYWRHVASANWPEGL